MCMPVYPYAFKQTPKNYILSCYNKTSMEHINSSVMGKAGKCINLIKKKKRSSKDRLISTVSHKSS